MPGVLSRLTPAAVSWSRLSVVNSLAGISLAVWIGHFLNQYQRRSTRKNNGFIVKNVGDKSSERARVDGQFVRRLARLVRVLVPCLWCAETGYVAAIALTLVARTVCDVWQIRNTTQIESALIRCNSSQFMGFVWEYARMMPVVSLVNNLLKHWLAQLQLACRVRLTRHLYDQYMSGFTFYQMNNLDNRIQNPDHLLTSDVNQFCSGLVDLYSNLSKPILDICLYVNRLTAQVGRQVPLYMILYLFVSGLFLTALRRPIGSMTVKEQTLEGEYRFVNSRLITNSEEIAFYQGSDREKVTLQKQFGRLVAHMKTLLHFKFSLGFVDNIIAKYIATLVGFFSVSLPFLSVSGPLYGLSAGERQLSYYQTGRMMVRLAESIGRLVLAGREMSRLSGFTVRISRLLDVLADLGAGHYQRTMLTDQQQHSHPQPADSELKSSSSSSSLDRVKMVLDPTAGTVVLQDHVIRFEHVPLVTPNGDVLVSELNFEVRSGMNVLVCGPNGCGKSSLFRILGELWPVFGGTLTKPHRSNLFYVPQRPYMTLGTLRDQVIYPDTVEQQLARGSNDEQLLQLLRRVELEYVHQRDNGWEAVADWSDVLSGGEKQRIAMARLFYHRPQFAILDECTSAVSVDVEGRIYDYCRQMNITLFTVSHRKSLWKHHEVTFLTALLITNLVHSVGKSCAVTYEQPIIDADTEDRFQLLLTDGSREPLVQQPRRPCWLQPQLVAEARELHRQRWSDINNAQVSSLFLMNSGPAQVNLLLATARSDTADKAVRRYMQTGLYTLGWALGDVWLPGDPAHASAQRVVGMHESAALLGRDRPVSDIQAPAGPASACSSSSERQRVIAAMRDDMIEYCASNVDGHSGQERAQNEVAGEKPEKSALTHDSNSTPYFCQLSMVMTQWMFVAAVLLHPHQYGLGRVTAQQLTAYVHLWRSIGCRLGVSDRFNLCAGSLSQVHALCWLIERRLMVPALCHVDGGWRCLTDALYDGLSTVLPSTNYESWLVHTLHDVLQLPVPRTRAALGWRSYWLYCVRRTLSEASSRRTGPSVHQTHLLKILRRTCERLQFSNQIMHVFDLL